MEKGENISYKLEVLIPTFNRPRKLHQALCTGINLQIPQSRFVVLDDGSFECEEVPGLGSVSTKEVCQFFDKKWVRYIKISSNGGIAAALTVYYQQYCEAEYTLLITDKDEFIDATPIHNALRKLDADHDLVSVQIPLRQVDREQSDRFLAFEHSRMTGVQFIKIYVSDDKALQHSGMYGIFRVSTIRQVGVPRSLNLQAYGLADGFGYDIDFLMMVVVMGDVEFETHPHIRRNVLGGATEKYPLTFSYCYYQYAKRIMKELSQRKVIERETAKKYITWWNLILLRALVVLYQPSCFREEKNTQRVRQHLKMPVFLYFLWQCIQYRFWPTQEMRRLIIYFCAFRFPRTKKLLYRGRQILAGMRAYILKIRG